MEFIDYTQTVSCERKPETLYRKKKWVPLWLWRIFSEPDVFSFLEYMTYKERKAFEEKLAAQCLK